jgi:CRP-like cAMP-binding protein
MLYIHPDTAVWLVSERANERLAAAERGRQITRHRSVEGRFMATRASTRRVAGHMLIRLGTRVSGMPQPLTYARS